MKINRKLAIVVLLLSTLSTTVFAAFVHYWSSQQMQGTVKIRGLKADVWQTYASPDGGLGYKNKVLATTLGDGVILDDTTWNQTCVLSLQGYNMPSGKSLIIRTSVSGLIENVTYTWSARLCTIWYNAQGTYLTAYIEWERGTHLNPTDTLSISQTEMPMLVYKDPILDGNPGSPGNMASMNGLVLTFEWVDNTIPSQYGELNPLVTIELGVET